jgi:hypothetical protein
MNKQFWADACQAALDAELSASTTSLLYGSHAFAVTCAVCSSVFSGFWLFRWRHVHKSSSELSLSMWPFTGRFLGLSFLSSVLGSAAWVSKLVQVYFSDAYAASSPDAAVNATLDCQRFFALNSRWVGIQATFRVLYSLEVACLFLSIILGLDRMSEHAHSVKMLSKETSKGSEPASRETTPEYLLSSIHNCFSACNFLTQVLPHQSVSSLGSVVSGVFKQEVHINCAARAVVAGRCSFIGCSRHFPRQNRQNCCAAASHQSRTFPRHVVFHSRTRFYLSDSLLPSQIHIRPRNCILCMRQRDICPGNSKRL